MQVIIGWGVAIVVFAAFTGGTASAASMAQKIMSLTGVTAGAILGGMDDMVSGFNSARTVNPAPAPTKAPAANSPRIAG